VDGTDDGTGGGTGGSMEIGGKERNERDSRDDVDGRVDE